MTEEKTLVMKDLEGKEVFLRPTGNNVRYTDTATKIIPAKIIKVSRVYATFIRGDFNIEDKGRIAGLHLDTGCNSGYQVFPDRQTVDDILFVEMVARKIINKFQYTSDYEKLDRETITKVANLLGIQIGD